MTWPPIVVHPDLADRIAALSLGANEMMFVALGDLWVEVGSIEAFWPIEGGSMVLVNRVALFCTLTPEQVVTKMTEAHLQAHPDVL